MLRRARIATGTGLAAVMATVGGCGAATNDRKDSQGESPKKSSSTSATTSASPSATPTPPPVKVTKLCPLLTQGKQIFGQPVELKEGSPKSGLGLSCSFDAPSLNAPVVSVTSFTQPLDLAQLTDAAKKGLGSNFAEADTSLAGVPAKKLTGTLDTTSGKAVDYVFVARGNWFQVVVASPTMQPSAMDKMARDLSLNLLANLK